MKGGGGACNSAQSLETTYQTAALFEFLAEAKEGIIWSEERDAPRPSALPHWVASSGSATTSVSR